MTDFVHPGIEQPKTECPFCGNVWQEHTLNEVGGCMAIMYMESSAALARSRKPSPDPPTVEICPVCNKLPAEHTDADLRTCVAKWRKHEKGATGLTRQGRFITVVAKNQEPDPVKLAQLRAQWMQALCSCGKAYGDHTQNELRACVEGNREKRSRKVPAPEDADGGVNLSSSLRSLALPPLRFLDAPHNDKSGSYSRQKKQDK